MAVLVWALIGSRSKGSNMSCIAVAFMIAISSGTELGLLFVGTAAVVVGFLFWLMKDQDAEDARKKKERAEKELRRKKAEQEAFEKYESVRKDYEAALDDLEAEDCKQNRINALEKGREWCATSREYAHGDKSVTAVDEQMITNDINARTCD